MRICLLFILFLTISCQKDLKHERYVVNLSTDTVLVNNPDFEEMTYTIVPGNSAMIYPYEVLDTDQDNEPCMWLGDTLIIKSDEDSLCTKSPLLEGNWTYDIEVGEKGKRTQRCTFQVFDEDFQ